MKIKVSLLFPTTLPFNLSPVLDLIFFRVTKGISPKSKNKGLFTTCFSEFVTSNSSKLIFVLFLLAQFL